MTTGAIIIEGHVQGLSNTRALGSKGIPVYVIDMHNCIARYSKYCRKFFRCPAYNSDKLADFLIDLAEKENIRDWILVPSNDHAVITISKNRKRLLEYYKLITPDESVIRNIYDKSNLLEIAAKCNVPIPATTYFSVSDVKETTLAFPLITKGKVGLDFYKATGRKAFISENITQLQQQLKEISRKVDLEHTFTQEVIPDNGENKTISFTAFCEKGEIRTYWVGEKLREHPIRFGTATYCRSIPDNGFLELSKPLLKELNYTGVCEVEYLLDPRDKQFKLIEINARTWLWVGLAKACGIDYANIIYNYLNHKPAEYPANYKTGVKWINYLTDTIVSVQSVFTGKLNIFKYLKSLTKKKVRATFTCTDPLPAIMLVVLSVYLAKKRIVL